VRLIHSQPHEVRDERLAQPGRDETIPILVWLDDGVKLNYSELGRALAHVRGLSNR
jgi:hypothetical protein